MSYGDKKPRKKKKAIDSSWNVPKKKTAFKPPRIPKKILNEFLESKIKISELNNVSMIEDGFLWTGNKSQRYRINVWLSEELEGMYCRKIYIGHSFFVHYNKETKEITDHTVAATIDLDKMKKKF